MVQEQSQRSATNRTMATNGVPKAPAAGLAAGNLAMTKGRVQGCCNCTLLRGCRHAEADMIGGPSDFPLTMVATGPPRKVWP